MERIAAIIVCYHPDRTLLQKNINSFVDSVDRLIIWRNSEFTLDFLTAYGDKVILMGNGSNEFIAHPLNEALEWCRDNGYRYLLTMDQDSVWEDSSHFIERSLKSDAEDVAVFAPYVKGQYEKPEIDYDAETVITSGSLVDVGKALKLGGFREDYAIYWVDGEFCTWARMNGYRIRVFHDCSLVQQFGKQTETKWGFSTSNYSPTVYYYIIRNMLWMHREFPQGVSLKCIAYSYHYYLRGIIFGEKNKVAKLSKVVSATWRGLFGKYVPRQKDFIK